MTQSIANTLKSSCYLLVNLFLYGYLSYQIERKEFAILVVGFILLFYCTFQIIRLNKNNFYFLIGASLLFRLLLIGVTPNLSQDFYRFIWDGSMLLEGYNPYLYLPKNLNCQSNFFMVNAKELFNGMGQLSAGHYTNYPPTNQFLFALANFFSNNSISSAIFGMRIFIILADLGTLYFGIKLLEKLGLEKHRIFWYILNPLVIIELTANLHFEGVMLFFLVWSMYLLQQDKWKTAALLLAFSISTKLLPLLVLALFFHRLGWKKMIVFCSITIGTNILLFLPFLSDELIQNYTQTIGLWFTNFEFNASIYYIIREIGFWIKGYNIIHTVGNIIPICICLFIIYQTIKGKNKTTIELFQSFLLVFTVYFLTATTIHPWYIINLVLITLFTRFTYPIIWSLTVILSYSAYSNKSFQENFWLIGLEYTIVILFLILEFRAKFSLKKSLYLD